MTYEERQEENRREYNKRVEQQQYRRQDEEWNKKRLEGERAQASRYFRQGDTYLGVYRLAGPAAANAYAEQMRAYQGSAAANPVPSMRAGPTTTDYVNRARAEVDAGDYIRAIDSYSKAMALEPGNAETPLERGFCHEMLKQYRESEHDYSEAISLSPKFTLAYVQRGTCRVMVRDFDRAINDLDLAERLFWEAHPDMHSPNALAMIAKIHYSRGIARFCKEDYKKASDDFGLSIRLRPEWPDPYVLRAATFRQMQFHELAIEDLTAVLKLNPRADRFRERAHCYRAVGNYSAALGDLDEVIRLDPTPGDYTVRGWWRLNSGGSDSEALSDFQIAIGLGDQTAFAYLGRAHAHRNGGNVAEAIEDYTTVIQLDPDDGSAYRERANCYRAVGNYSAALGDLDEVIRLDPTPGDYTVRGWWRLNSGGSDSEALSDFQIAIGLGDQTAFAYLGRAHAHRNGGNVAEAIEDYTTVIQLDPDDGSAYSNRARLHFHLGEYQTALADFDEDIRLNPTKPFSYLERGDCHLKRGNRVAAKQDYMTAASLYFKQNTPEKGKEAYAQALTT